MNQTQLFWKEALEGIEQRITEKYAELDDLIAQKIDAQRRFKEASLWDLHLYTHLNSMGHTKLDAVTWDVVQSYIDDKRYLIQHLNWSGDDVWKVFFYKGTKKRPHKDCVGTATRVGWMEDGKED